MIARDKDTIRKVIDFLVVLPTASVFTYVVWDSAFLGRNATQIFWISFVLILALLVKKWLKPKTLSEQIDRLREEDIHLKDKIVQHQQSIKELEKSVGEAGKWSQDEINSKNWHIDEMKIRIDEIVQELTKLEIIQA